MNVYSMILWDLSGTASYSYEIIRLIAGRVQGLVLTSANYSCGDMSRSLIPQLLAVTIDLQMTESQSHVRHAQRSESDEGNQLLA